MRAAPDRNGRRGAREVIADGISNYNMRFLETTPEATDAFPDLLLNGSNNTQQQLQARFGG